MLSQRVGARKEMGSTPRLLHHLVGAADAVLHFLGQEWTQAGNVEEGIAHRLVVEAVTADLVACVAHEPDDIGMLSGGVSGEEKGRVDPLAGEHVKDARRPVHQPFIEGREAADVRLHVKTQHCLHLCHCYPLMESVTL
jgi:hypothetical protein